MTTADAAYDRLHGADGHTQAVVARILRVIQQTCDAQGGVTMLRLAENIAAEVAADLAELQWNAVEMARKADIAEARAEGAEAELERLKAAADLVGHQGACLVDPCDCWMADLAPLLEDWSQ